MRRTIAAILALGLIAPAAAQVNFSNVPASTVVGRTGIGVGPVQAIPFSVLSGNLAAAMSGDCTETVGGVITCTKTGGVALTAAATTAFGTSGHAIPYLDGINTWANDQYFKSGRPWYDVRAYGAVGDGTTDDSTALNAAATAASITGGIFFVPNGNYCWKSGGSFTGGVAVQIMGEGLNTELQTCGADVALLTLNNARHYVHDIVLQGSLSLTTTKDTITLGSNCTECRLDHVLATGGRYVLNNAASDVALSYLTLTQSYGGAIIYNGAASGTAQFWGNRLKVDQLWPVSTPTRQAAFSARGNTTAYVTGNVVSSGGFLIQATNNGTSGGSPPTLLTYGTNIVDGTVTWKLVAPTTFAAIQLDTGSSVVTINHTDMSGPFSTALSLTNTLAGTGPQGTIVADSFFAPILYSMQAVAGAGLSMRGNQSQNCITNGCVGFFLNTGWVGDAIFAENLLINHPTGIYFNAGTNTIITGNNIFNSSSAAIVAACPVTQFVIANNNLGSSVTWGTNAVGLILNAGLCDSYYGIPTNDFTGATTAMTNAATGTKTDAFPQFGSAVFKAVNFNSANTDNSITVPVPPGAWGYLVTGIRISNASQTLTTATFGLFTAAAAGGTAIQAAATAITVATATLGSANSAQLTTPATANTTAYAPATTPLFFRVGTAEGAAATGTVELQFTWLY